MIEDYAQGDGFCIASTDDWSILELARLFGGTIQLSQNNSKGNRKRSVIAESKDYNFSIKHSLQDYVNELRDNDWEPLC